MPKPWEKAAAATPQQPTSEPAPTGRKPWEKAARVFSGGQSSANPVAKTAPKPAPMSQPDATPWGDGQAFDDMYARKPQTDPMNMPLMPGARTLTSGQPSQLKVPTQRGPVMSPAQRRATQPTRDAAVAQRTEQANRWKSDSPFGTPVDEMGMPIAVTDAQRDGGMYGVRDDVGKGIVASPIHAERALVGAAEATLNTPGDLTRSLAVPFAMGFDPTMQGIIAGAEFGVGADTLPERSAAGAKAGGYMDMQQKLDAAPRFDFSAAKIPVPKELESVSGTLAEGFLQYLAARGALGKFMPGGKTLAQFAKDVGATGIGYSGDSPRAADMLDPESMGMLADYVRLLKTQPGDTQGMGRFKNMAEDATINLLAMGLLRGGQATTNALNPQALTPTNAGAARPGSVTPQANMLNPAARSTPQPAPSPQTPPVGPAAPAQPTPQPTPPPQAATAPPVPPVPPAAPTATAAAPQPTPAPVAAQPARQALGPAEQAVNAMPRKTREALWRALSNSGMNRQQAEAAIKSLNDLPEGQNSMFDFELVRRFGQQYPRLKTNLQAMGRDWAITIPKDPRKGSPNRVLDDNTSTQIKSEGEFIDRTAQEVFGQPVNDTLDELAAGKRQLSAQYNSLLDFENPYGPNINRMRGQNKIKRMQEIDGAIGRLTSYLQRPEVMSEVPDWVRDRVMLDVGKDMRERLSDSAFLGYMRLNSPELANLLQQGTPLRYSDDLWKQITTLYPTQAAHSLQSAYARAIRDALKGTDVEQRTAAEILIRKRGGSRVRANAASPDKRGFGLLHYLEEAVPGYRDLRREYGDVIGAEDAAELPRDFFRIANDDVALKDWIEVKNDLSPQQQAALKSGMTTQIQQALRKKHETLDPWELDQPDALSTPNLTTLSQQPVLNALEKAFGADGKKMADAIRAASTRTDRIRSIHPNYGPRSAINQEAIRNASNIYGDPWGSEQNVIDSVSGSLGAAGVLSALNPATAAAAPLLLTGAAAKGLWNQWKRNKQLTGEESEALADFFFRSRRPDLAEQVRGSRGTSAGDYAGAMLRDASIGTVAAAASDGDLLNNDPTTLAIGALGGAGVGAARAVSRNASSKIKPPRNGNRLAPGGAPTPPAGPRPLPGQTSPSSPVIGGAALGALTSGGATYAATGDEDAALKAGILGGIGGGVVGNRLAKGAKPKAPPAPGFDQRFMKEAQRLVSYNGGVDKALKAQQYVIDQLKNSKAPNAQDRLNRAVSVQYAIRRMADRSNRELDEIAATAPRSGPPGVKPPPVRNGFGGRDLPMGSGSLIEADAISRIASGKTVPTSAELDDALKGLREAEFDDLVRQFGGDRQKAEKFRSLWRQAENAPTRQEADMLDAQRQKLIEGMPDVEPREFVDEYALRQLRDAFRDIENGNAVKALNDSMTDLPTLREVQDGKISSRAQAALAILRKATQEARLQGADPKQMMNSALENYGRRFSDPVDAEFMVGEVKKLFAAFDPSQEQSSKLLAGMSGNSRGIADNLKQDAALAAFGSAGGSFANQDDPQAGALGGMGIALGGKYVPRAVNALRGAGRVKPPPVRGADQAGIRTGPPTATKPAAGNKHGLEPSFREVAKLKGATAIDKQMRPPVTKAFTPGNADKQLSNIDRLLANHPAPEASSNAWSRMMADMVGDVDAPIPPHQFLKDMKNGGEGAVERLKKLTPEQIAEADHGFHQAEEFRQAYVDGDMRPTDTTKLFMWSFLSRGVSPYVQESMFLDAFKGADEWIEHAVNGTFDGNVLNGYKKWASEVSPAGSGLPGSGTQHNLNAFGEHFLRKMAQRADDGETYLKKLHDMIADPNLSGPDIRRAFSKFPEGIGIDNKVVSFTLLASGRKDVMVLDRIQVRALFNDGRFGNRNIYDPLKEDGAAVAGTALADITYGAHGVVLYEAIERALAKQVDAIYAAVGRPQDASIGRYHWDTWNAASGQEASHGTLGAILKGAKKSDNPLAGIRAKEGEYGGYAYNSEYGISADGERTFHYTTPKGSTYEFSVPAYREFIAEVKKAKNGVVPSNFKVTQSGNAPWTSRPEVNTDALDALAARYADRSTGERAGRRSGSQSAGGSALPGNGQSKVASGPKRLAPTTSVPQVRRPKPPPQTMGFGGMGASRPKPPPAKGQTGNALAGKPPKKPAPPKKAEEVALINALKKARANETASRRRNVMRDNRDELNSVAEEAVMQAERDLLEYRDRQFRQAAEGARWMDRGAAVANVGKKAAVATGNQIKKTMMKNDAELLKTYGVAVGGIAGIALGARALAGPDGDDEKKKEVLPPTDKRYFVETKLKKRPEMLGPVQNALVELGMLDVIDADTKWGTKTRDAIEAYLSRKPDRLPNLPIQDYEVPALMAEAYGGYQENGKWFYNTGEPIVYPPRRNDTYLPARPLRPDEARRMTYDKRTEAERNNKLRP